MDIQRPGISRSGASTGTLSVSGAELRAWRAGQVLDATVLGAGGPGRTMLAVNGQRLEARTDLNLAAGQPLKLRVEPGDGTQVILRLVPDSARAPAAAADNPQLAAWRAALPRQAGLAPLLANLLHLQRSPADLPAGPAALLRQLIAAVPTRAAVTSADGLRQALQSSGLMLEARLAQALTQGTVPPLAGDLKARLLELGAGLRQAGAQPAPTDAAPPPPLRNQALPPQSAANPSLAAGTAPERALAVLLGQTDGVLARLTLSQLASTPGADAQTPMWLAELPVRDGGRGDVLGLRIERDGVGADPERGPNWAVTLSLDLPGLGPTHTRIRVQGAQVSTAWWAERPGTAGLIQQHLEELSAALGQAGLQAGTQHCSAGPPPPGTSGDSAPPLVDLRA